MKKLGVLKLVCRTTFVFLTILCSCANKKDTKESGAIYYVDNLKGKDSNCGTSIEKAWSSFINVNNTLFKPGDKILLRAGGEWNEQLWPKGSGSEGFPIIVDKYGQGGKPLIAVNGNITDAVKLQNQQYWEINNLEITNFRSGDDQYNPANMKRGVYVLAQDTGEIKHIHFKNLHIHHVNGLLEPNFPAKNNGGIYFEVLGNSKKTWFNDFLIDSCYINDVDRTGISNKSTWWGRTIKDNMDWVPSLNVVIRNTIVERAAYNAVIIRCSDRALVEHCVFKDNGIKGNGNALFIYQTDNSLIQYNEAYGTVYQEGTTDAAGFDSDGYNRNSIIQYNYSHDNGLGGFVMAVGDGSAPFNDGAIFRYNICQNNKREGLRLSGYPTNVTIYNNIFYIDSLESEVNIVNHKKWGGWPSKISYYNNVFYNLSKNSYYSLGEGSNIKFSHNVFFGKTTIREPEDSFKITENPMFVKAGSGKIGIITLNGYKLQEGSPCIDNGILIKNHAKYDFWRNPVPTNIIPDCGANEFNN